MFLALAGRQARKDALETTGLQEVLAWHMLPLLSLRDLARCACTCKALRDISYLRNEVWASAAAEKLSPQHPLLASKDRSAVQDFLQRRLQARRTISSGPALSSVELSSTGHVSKMQFSVCGRLFAVMVASVSISVFAVQDCSRLWQRSVFSILEQGSNLQANLTHWGLTQWHLDLTCLSICWVDTRGLNVHFRQLEACTGNSILSLALPLSSIRGLEEAGMIQRHQIAFSHSGHDIAASVVVQSDPGANHLVIFVLDATTFELKFSTSHHSCSPKLNLGMSLQIVWSNSDAIFAACGTLTTLQHQATCPLGKFAAQIQPVAFNKPGTYLACIQFAVDFQQAASFIDLSGDVAGAELFKVHSHDVVGFLSAETCVLMPEKRSHAVCEIWNIPQQVCLHAMESRALAWTGSRELLLDDFVLFMGYTKRQYRHGLFLCSLNAGGAKLCLESIASFCVSPDETVLAIVGYSQRHLSLVKLC